MIWKIAGKCGRIYEGISENRQNAEILVFCTVLVFLAIHQVFPQKNGLHREKPLLPIILPVFRYTLNVESTGGQKCGIGKKG